MPSRETLRASVVILAIVLFILLAATRMPPDPTFFPCSYPQMGQSRPGCANAPKVAPWER